MARRIMLSTPLLALSICLGCSMPAGMNDECRWPASDDERGSRVDQQHLIDDVMVAEELAVRYADARGKLRPLYVQTRRDCEAKLFGAIAQSHGVTLAKIDQARQRLADRGWDPAVHLPLAVFYVAAALAMARRIRHRFPGDERAAAILTTLFVSVGLGA